MPKIPNLPPLSEPVAQDDLIIIENTSTGDTEQAEVADLIAPTLRAVRFYTASTTWNKPSGLTANANGFVIVKLRGGGGAGGGTGATTGLKTAGGGGQGEYAIKKIASGSLASSVTVTIGAGQTGVSGENSSQANGGGTTSFGAHVTALGGGRAEGSNATNTSRAGGVGGTGGTGADLALPGAIGHAARPGGTGGGGGGGAGNASNGNQNGANAVGNDGAGGAGAQDSGTTQRTGGSGAAGHMIVEEWY